MKRSKWWKYYQRNGPRDAICNICSKNIRTSGNTTNLMKHIQIHTASEVINAENSHPPAAERTVIKMNRMYRKHNISSHETTAYKLKSLLEDDTEPQPKLFNTTTASSEVAVKSRRFSVDDSTNATFDGMEIAVDAVHEHQQQDDEFLPETILYPASTAEKMESTSLEDGNTCFYTDIGNNPTDVVTKCVLYYICMDQRPIETINGVGFKRLMKELCPTYKTPELQVLRDYLNSFYTMKQLETIDEFKKIAHISLTCHMSSSAETERTGANYLSISANYMVQEKLRSRLLATIELPQHSAQQVTQALDDTCCMFEIDKAIITCFVASGGTNVKNGVGKFMGNPKHLPCFMQMINHIVESALKMPAAAALCQRVKDAMNAVRRTVESSESQAERGQKQQPTQKSFDWTDSTDKWIGVYRQLVRFVDLPAYIQRLTNIRTALEHEEIKVLLLLLRPFEFAMRDIATDQLATISKVIPLVNTLKKEVGKVCVPDDSEMLGMLKDKLINQLEKYIDAAEENTMMAVACLMDPRFKQIPFTKQLACEKAIMKIRSMIGSTHTITTNSTTTGNADAADGYDFWQHYKDLAYGADGLQNSDELDNYLERPVACLNSDPFALWRDMRSTLPTIYPLAIKYLCIPASAQTNDTIPAWGSFGGGGSSVTASCVDKLRFLRDCTDAEWGI